MELEERLSYLENVRDWQSLVEELEKGIASSAPNADKAAVPPQARAGPRDEVPRRREGAQALSGRVQAQPGAHREPRGGAERLLGSRQAQHGPEAPRAGAQGRRPDGARASALLLELGDVLCDQGDWEKAAATYARALGASGGKNPEASALPRRRAGRRGRLARAHLAALVRARERGERRAGEGARAPARRARRAALRARRGRRAARAGLRRGPGRQADRGALRGAPRRAGSLRRARADAAPGPPAERAGAKARARAWRSRSGRAGCFATRTSTSARASSRRRSSSTRRTRARSSSCARPTARRRGDWDRVLDLAEEAATRVENGDSTFLLAQAGTIAWRQLGNLIRARLSFERLSAVSPEHPQLRAFEAQIGETPEARAAADRRRPACREPRIAPLQPPPPSAQPSPRRPATSPPAPAPPCEARAARGRSAARAAVAAAACRPRRVAAAAPPPAPAVAGRRAKIAELRAAGREARGGEALQRVRQDAPPARGARPRRRREGRALLEGRRPLHHQVREPGRGGEGLRGGPRDRSRQRAGGRLPAADVREAPRLGEAPRAAAARGRAHAAGRRARGEVPRDREARDRAREEARGLHRALARGPRQRRVERRGARRARGALRAREGLREARERARAAGRGHVRRAREDPGPDEARHDLRRAAEQRRRRRQRVAHAPHARPERPKRAGRAQEEVPRARPLGRPRGLLRRDAASGTSSSASSSSRRRRRPSAAAEDLAPLQDRPALGATRSRSPIARRRPTRRCSSSRPTTCRRPRRSSRSTPRRTTPRRSRNAIEVKLGHEQDPAAKLELYPRGRRPLRGQGQGSAEGVRPLPLGVRALPRRRATSEDVERAAKVTGALGRGRRGVPPARSSRRTRTAIATSAIMLRLRLGRVLVDERAADRRGARGLPRGLRGRRRERRGDRRARAALPADVALRRAPRHLREEARSRRPTPDEKKAINYEIAKLYENEIKDVDQAIDTYVAGARRRADATRRRSPRSTCSTGGSGAGSRTSTSCAVASSSTSASESSSISSSASAQTLEKHLGDAAGALENYREILFLDPSTRARARRSRRCSKATCARRPPRSSSRSTKSAATGRS